MMSELTATRGSNDWLTHQEHVTSDGVRALCGAAIPAIGGLAVRHYRVVAVGQGGHKQARQEACAPTPTPIAMQTR